MKLHVTYHRPPGFASPFIGVRCRDEPILLPALSCRSAVRMARGLLISLAFWMTRLAGDVWPFAEKLNDPNHIRGPDGQAFPLPSKTHLLPGTLCSVLRPPDHSPSSTDRQIEAEAPEVKPGDL